MALETLGAGALALALPGSGYLALLTAAAVWPQRPSSTTKAHAAGAAADTTAALRIVIVVPAHNESTSMLRTLAGLRREADTDPMAQVVVVADNCSDDTATVARSAGVRVLERHDTERRGKGYALQFAFDACVEADWFIIVDADTDVAPGFLAMMRRSMAGADALQCRYGARDPMSSRRATLGDIALGGWNVLRPRGRAALGLSAGILGNGFALSRQTLQAVPYSAHSIIEDVEYHQLLVQAGMRVRWVDDTQVRGDVAEGPAAVQQRARWEGGRIRLIADRAPALMARLVRGQWRLSDPLLDLALLPLSWHVALLLLAVLLGSATVTALAGAALVGVALHVAAAMWLIGAGRSHWRALLGAPAYLVWKLCLASAIWRAAHRQASWVRTERRPN